MLMRRAVVALGKRRALAGLALAGRRTAAGDAAVEGARLDLILDEGDGCGDSLLHGPGDLGLHGDREITPDVLEEGAVGLREVQRVGREPLHRLLAVGEHLTPVLQALRRRHVRVDEVLDRPVDGARILIHAVTKLVDAVVHLESYPLGVKWPETFVNNT